MSTLSNKTVPLLATDIWFDQDKLYVNLSDGREIGIPLEWFPRLKNATPEQKSKWKLIGKGIGIHWSEIDEDIAVECLIQPEAFPILL
jgi:hypothetical protein